MTTIIIKSFNRPYYLHRCLESLYRNVKGNYEVKIVDDGTPELYLTKIVENFPLVKINKSNQFAEKNKAIKNNIVNGEKIDGFTIPTDLWYKTVKESRNYVLVIEDDVWFVDQIDVDNITNQMETYNVALTKLGWLGNYKDDQFCDVNPITESLISVLPRNLFTANKLVMDLFMYNKFKFFTILYKLGIVNNLTKRKYWAINSILMGLYQKEYWLAIWEDAHGKVDEKQQLRNAAAWYHKNKNAVFARTPTEVLKTTFKSSATSSYHEYGNGFDVNRMNYILNEAWLKGEFDVMENYPKDFSDEYIQRFLEKENHKNAQFNDWMSWADKFREQYRSNGADVNN